MISTGNRGCRSQSPAALHPEASIFLRSLFLIEGQSCASIHCEYSREKYTSSSDANALRDAGIGKVKLNLTTFMPSPAPTVPLAAAGR